MERAMREHRLDAGLRGWIVNTAKKNLWRVPSRYDLSDLIQDGYLCYCICNVRYRYNPRDRRGRTKRPPWVRQQRHFMALVQRTFLNHIKDLATERTRQAEMLVAPDSPALAQVEPNEALFSVLLRQLPAELKQLLVTLQTTSKDIPMLRFADGTRETRNEYLCRLLGVDPALVSIEDVFREHFSSITYVSNVSRERKS